MVFFRLVISALPAPSCNTQKYEYVSSSIPHSFDLHMWWPFSGWLLCAISSLKVNRRSGGTSLQSPGQKLYFSHAIWLVSRTTLKMEAVYSTETLVDFERTALRNILWDSTLQLIIGLWRNMIEESSAYHSNVMNNMVWALNWVLSSVLQVMILSPFPFPLKHVTGFHPRAACEHDVNLSFNQWHCYGTRYATMSFQSSLKITLFCRYIFTNSPCVLKLAGRPATIRISVQLRIGLYFFFLQMLWHDMRVNGKCFERTKKN
jgi:hypothetical protein